ncbi:MAG: copper resistance system multicopper oxidase [Proteobacteria bacterium]|nr:copper resistance system multicopper oxidase [Pseudomonadota bacterium]
MNLRFPIDLRRRRFVQGLALGGLGASLGWQLPARAAEAGRDLSGTDFNLTIGQTPVNITGAARMATTVNGLLPGPTLRWREGTTVTICVTNRLRVPTSIHWHGIILPADMDGVPGLSFPGIAPGETFTYRFPVRQSGTYWYHSHSGFEEQTGLYGAIIIDSAQPDPIRAEREHVVMLNDWSDEDPHAIFAHLKKMPAYYNRAELTTRDFFDEVARAGLKAALASRKMWNEMRMSPRDLVDVTGATYTYLMNGHAPSGNWTGLFKPGERVRLRLINGSSNSFFDVRIPGLKLRVVAADGQDVEAVEVDELRIATAETYDVIVQPRDDRAYTIFAQSMSRDGYARGTLAPRAGMQADVPALDPLPLLTMGDMMGAMPHGSGHGMDHGDMAGMTMPQVHHARSEYRNPNVDMRVDSPRTNLDDPGIGLRDNGRRVLTYADLRSIGGSLYPEEIAREIELHLTGNMQRFVWGFDGLKFSQAKPIHLRHGEHVRLVLVNDTMMTHPIHLHGMWSELEDEDGEFQVRKHTVSVQPAQRVTYRVMADAFGRWAYHCHLLYHMEAGMMREVVVS